MKANELMIGDWGLYNETHQQILEISGIDDEVYLETDELVHQSEIQPIPLTTEILEKNGWKHEFDKTDYMVKYDLGNEGKDCWMMWAIKEHNLDIQRQDENLDMYNLKVSRVVTPCDYVHQLQHALRLCGIEKTIEL